MKVAAEPDGPFPPGRDSVAMPGAGGGVVLSPLAPPSALSPLSGELPTVTSAAYPAVAVLSSSRPACADGEWEDDLDEEENEPFLMDSVSLHFSAWRLIKHFAINCVPYLLLPFLPRSTWAPQQYYNPYPLVVLLNHLAPIILATMLVACSMVPDRPAVGQVDPEGRSYSDLDVLGGAVWVPLLYFCLQRLMIGLKYASLSDSEYQRLMSADAATSLKYQMQLQLLSSWVSRGIRPLMRYEIAAASARVGLDIRQLAFRLPVSQKVDSISAIVVQ